MEEGTPVLERFTETVSDGPSHPLMRKLMSMMLSPAAPREEPEISGFFMVDNAPSAGESSRRGDDISQTVGCPVEDMETVVQSGFRFAGAEGCCDSPRAENYFTESSLIPADIAEKVPIDFLHAINNVLDTKVVPMHKSHHHGRRKNPKRTRAAPGVEIPGLSPAAAGFGQEMMLRRLDRLEEICLRTESYMHAVLGTIDRRLQLLESEALRLPTQDSSCSPRFPTAGGFSTEVVTPDMFMLQSPHPDRSHFAAATAVLEAPADGLSEDAGICLSPIDAPPSPAVISFPAAVLLPSDDPQSEYPFSTAAAAADSREEQRQRTGLDEASPVFPGPDDHGDLPQVSAIAVFSLAAEAGEGQQNQVNSLLSEPVVMWENDGFPYLRPAYHLPTEPRLRDTTVLTWEAAGCLSPDSSSEDERATSLSSDDAFSFCNSEDHAGEELLPQHRHSQEFHRKEEGMLEEISSILKNICSNLEVLKPGTCSGGGRQSALTCSEEEEIFSVLEGMFSRLAFLPQPEDVLVNILPSDSKQYAELPQREEEAEKPKVSLVFTQEGASASQDMRMQIEVPALDQEAGKQPVILHIAISPPVPNSDLAASSVVQDISVSVEGPPCRGPLVSETEDSAQELSPEPEREVVPVVKDKVELTGGVVADYTLKVVPGQGDGSFASSKVVSTDDKNMVINNQAVSSVIHELCFSLDVPTSSAARDGDEDLPLQIGISLTGDAGVEVVNEQRPLIRDMPAGEAEASIVFSLEALQQAEEEPSCSKPGFSERDCEISSVHQDVCISLEVPTSDEGSGDGLSGIQIGLAVKSVPTRQSEEDERSSYLISCVEISDDQEVERASLAEIPACLARVEQPSDEDQEEDLAPLKSEVSEEEGPESIVSPPPSPVEAAPETHEYLFKEEKQKASDDWVIDSIYLPKENLQQADAKVPRPVLRGMTPMDLVRGSLHFDGKACLLAVCMDDLWSAEDMCQAPASAAAAFAKQRSVFQPLTAGSAKKGGGGNQESGCLRDMPAWLGDAGSKPAAGEKNSNRSLAPAFGFRRQPGQKQQQQQASFGFCAAAAAGAAPVFGFRNLNGKLQTEAAAAGTQQQQTEAAFGFRSVAAKKPPLAPKAKMQVAVPVAEEDSDSALSVVSRSPAIHSRGKLPPDEQPPQLRLPDSPGAKSTLATASSSSGTASGYSDDAAAAAGTAAVLGGVIETTGAEEGAIVVGVVEESGTGTGTETGKGGGFVSVGGPKTALDLIDAGGGSEEDIPADWSSELHVMPVDPFAAADVAAAVGGGGGQDDTFFDALQCSGKHGAGGGSHKLKKYLKDKVWNKLSCYGTGMPDSDSENTSCHHHRI